MKSGEWTAGDYYVLFVTPEDYVATYTSCIETLERAKAHAEYLKRQNCIAVTVVKRVNCT